MHLLNLLSCFDHVIEINITLFEKIFNGFLLNQTNLSKRKTQVYIKQYHQMLNSTFIDIRSGRYVGARSMEKTKNSP